MIALLIAIVFTDIWRAMVTRRMAYLRAWLFLHLLNLLENRKRWNSLIQYKHEENFYHLREVVELWLWLILLHDCVNFIVPVEIVRWGATYLLSAVQIVESVPHLGKNNFAHILQIVIVRPLWIHRRGWSRLIWSMLVLSLNTASKARTSSLCNETLDISCCKGMVCSLWWDTYLIICLLAMETSRLSHVFQNIFKWFWAV